MSWKRGFVSGFGWIRLLPLTGLDTDRNNHRPEPVEHVAPRPEPPRGDSTPFEEDDRQADDERRGPIIDVGDSRAVVRADEEILDDLESARASLGRGGNDPRGHLIEEAIAETEARIRTRREQDR